MIKDIQELNFPAYATLSQATVNITDMGEKTIEAEISIDGDISPDFSYDWEIMFKGEKYIMPLRKPQGSKENTSLNSKISLTFYHWAIYEMKRHFFAEMTSIESGTAIASQYEVPMSLTLPNFVIALNNVLDYYYKGNITAKLNPEWIPSDKPTLVSISYTYIWDLVAKIYELYAVRWYLESVDGKCVIKIGFPAEEIGHVFEYGYEGGLLKVERQVQSSEIRNIILGRGGEKNLPYRYFKDVDSDNDSFHADPDWIPELANVYFSELRDSTFRSYVQGWKAKHYKGTVTKEQSAEPWAWEKGYTDQSFNPVEYVKDDASIRSYGELYGATEANEDIYPTIQGVEIPPYGEIDEVVDVTEFTLSEEEIESLTGSEKVPGITRFSFIMSGNTQKVQEKTSLTTFTVPEGTVGNLLTPIIKVRAKKSQDRNDYSEMVEVKMEYIAKDMRGNEYPPSGIPNGTYNYVAKFTIKNNSADALEINIETDSFILQYGPGTGEVNNGTFDIWVKNLWGTEKSDNEDNSHYAERVWLPILGNRESDTPKVVFSDGWLGISEDYEFEIIGIPKYDTNKTYKGVQSHWKITLSKSDAEYDATGKYIPNKETNAHAGDHFFFTGIDIPYMYYVEAEKRLTAYKKDVLEEKKEIMPTWSVSFDRVRISNLFGDEDVPLIDKIKAGCSINIRDKRFLTEVNDDGEIIPISQQTLYVQSITYTYREASSEDAALLPDVEVTLSDKVYASTNPISLLQGEVEAIGRQLGSISNVSQAVRVVGDKRYFRKDISDTSVHRANLYGGVSTNKIISRKGVDGAEGRGFSFSEDEKTGYGKGFIDSLNVREKAEIPNIVTENVSSKEFFDGFAGNGFRIWQDDNGRWCLTVDNITARGMMTIYELIISKIKSVGGQINVSSSNGKVVYVYEEGDNYVIKFEEKNTFEVGDLVRCQTWTGNDIKSYWVEVSALTDDGYGIIVPKSEFIDAVPKEGDEIVLMGSTTNEKRQNVILISATEDGKPRVDVLNGIKEKSLEGSLRARLGNLEDIVDPWFPDVNGVKTIRGDGLYSDNAYLKGTFKFSNGQDLATRFSITDGKIESSVEALREDFVEEKGFLSNPSFNRGLENWEIDDAAMLYETGQTCIIANSELLSTKESGAALMYDDSRRVMRIKNTSIIQRNAAMRAKPEIVQDTDKIGYPALVHFSVFVKVISAGTLSVGFDGETTEGFHQFLPFSQQKDLVQTTGYVQITMSGEWTGSGDFKFEFTGELYAYMFILTSDPVEAFSYRYKNLFEQSARLTKLAISVFDNDGDILTEKGFMVTPGGAGIYAMGVDGKASFIGVVDEKDGNKIKLTSDHIQLEGYTTINNHFIVHENGDLEATNATISGTVYASSGSFSGEINATSGNIGGISISNDHLGLGLSGEGVSLYNDMIVFNEPNRQALLGTRQSTGGLPVMLRLTDTVEDTIPKSAIYFSVSNSSFANLAFSGDGDGVLNGIVEGIKFYRLSATTRNTIYHADISKGNHMIVACSADGCKIELPTLSEIRNALNIPSGTSFAIRFLVYIESMYETGGYIVVGGRRMTMGDSVEYLLTYDAENDVYSKYTIMENISYTLPSGE